MRLIIAEKHSVGQAIAQAIGGGRNGDGCIRCGNDTVTWAQGHLVDLLTPNEYQDRGWDKWDIKALPLDPTGDWRWKVNRQRDADKQYRIVKRLLDERPDELVNACDPDREGEAIFRRIVAYAGAAAPMKRLWVASLEEDAIREALADMERRLSDVEHGKARAIDVYEEFRSYALRLPGEAERDVRSDLVRAREPRNREPVGKCPRCGADVVKTGSFWQCSTNRREKQPDGTWETTAGCGFRIFPKLAGKTLTDSQVRRILAGQKVAAKGFTSKAGRKFDATIVLDKDHGVRFDFPPRKK